jgi:hypothetical protein
MSLPTWRNVPLEPGVLREPIPDNNRITLWVPRGREGRYQYWERVSNLARADVTVECSVCATAATSIRMRQPLGGLLGKLFRRFRNTGGDRTWTLPNGAAAEQCGERDAGLLLAWADDETRPLDETRIRSRWPGSERVEKLEQNLFLVGGVASPAAESGPVAALPKEVEAQLADAALAAARRTGDRRGEASALTDLGIAHLRQGNAARAAALLEEALALARQLGDPSLESDFPTGAAGERRRLARHYLARIEQARGHLAGNAGAHFGSLVVCP